MNLWKQNFGKQGETLAVKNISADAGRDNATATYTITLADGSAYDAADEAERTISAWEPILAKFGL